MRAPHLAPHPASSPALLAAVLLAGCAANLGHSLGGAVTSPAQGVVCDRKAGFCADAQGISLGLTRVYLSEAAERQLLEAIHQVGSANFNPSRFTLSNGVFCRSDQRVCHEGKYSDRIDPAATRALYGTLPP